MTVENKGSDSTVAATPTPGTMLLVSNNDFSYAERELLAITADGKWICWNADKTNALKFDYCKSI